jgi:hypothetical protein
MTTEMITEEVVEKRTVEELVERFDEKIEKEVAAKREDIERDVERLRKRARVVVRILLELDIDLTGQYTWGGYSVTLEELIKLRKLVGRLKKVGMETLYGEERDTHVNVVVTPADKEYKDVISFKYKRELTPNSKCKVVAQVSTYHTVVCSTG